MVEQIKSREMIKNSSADASVSGRKTKSHTSKHDQMNNDEKKTNKEKK